MTFAAGQNNTSSDCTASVAPQWGAVKRAALRLGFSIASLSHCTRLRVSAHMMLTCIGRHSFWSYAVWVLLRVRLSQRPIHYCPPLRLDKPLTHRRLARSPRRPALAIVFPLPLPITAHTVQKRSVMGLFYGLMESKCTVWGLTAAPLKLPFSMCISLKTWFKLGQSRKTTLP